MQTSLRALGLVLLGGVVAASCGGGGGGGGGGSNGTGTGGGGGSSGVAGNNAGGNSGTTGSGGSAGSAAGAAGTGGSATGTGGGAGSGGVTGTGGATGGGGGTTAGAGGRGGTGGTAGAGTGGSAGSTAGAGGRGGGAGNGSAGNGSAGAGGRGGSTAGAGGGGTGGGATSCAGHALSLSANGTGQAADTAYAHVELTLASDLPIGNAQRTIEFWAYIKTTDWIGELNQVYYYGTSGTAASFGLDFGTNLVTGMNSNHATLDPFTGGGFSDDSMNDLGINSSSNQWVHVAMVWNGTNLITYVNGLPKITTSGTGGATMLATGSSVLSLGCNPTNNNCFSGLFDELRIWSVARTATQIHDSYNKPVATDSAGLVGYWKFDEASGTTTADAVTTAAHTAHNGTLKAMATAQNPTFVAPPTPLPLVCP